MKIEEWRRARAQGFFDVLPTNLQKRIKTQKERFNHSWMETALNAAPCARFRLLDSFFPIYTSILQLLWISGQEFTWCFLRGAYEGRGCPQWCWWGDRCKLLIVNKLQVVSRQMQRKPNSTLKIDCTKPASIGNWSCDTKRSSSHSDDNGLDFYFYFQKIC